MNKDVIITRTESTTMRDLTKVEQLEWLVNYYQNKLIDIKECLENAKEQLDQARKLERNEI